MDASTKLRVIANQLRRAGTPKSLSARHKHWRASFVAGLEVNILYWQVNAEARQTLKELLDHKQMDMLKGLRYNAGRLEGVYVLPTGRWQIKPIFIY
jgi:hypothetical protein